MATFLLLLLLLLLFVDLSASAQTTNFIFQDGFSTANLTLGGNATISPNGILSLTTNLTDDPIQGLAFFSRPLPFWYPSTPESQQPLSFSTSFVFDLLPGYRNEGGFGLAFVISANTHVPLPERMWRFEGLFNKSINRNSSHILAVEFATNTDKVSIDVNGTVNSTTAGYFSTSRQFTNLSLVGEEKSLQAWVEYNNKDTTLRVFLDPLNVTSKPNAPLVSAKIDLRNVMLDHMYVGFLAASGMIPFSSYVRGWSFKVNGDADAFDLAKLPEVPIAKKVYEEPTPLTVLLPIFSAAVVAVAIGMVIVVVKRRAKYAEVLEKWENAYVPHRISYRDLSLATKGFRDRELLGSWGFGKMYKGVLPRSKTVVTVTRVTCDSNQGMREFVAEIVSMKRMRHRNLVQFLGYSRRKGELLLVHEYMPYGSVDRHIFDSPRRPLDWDRRLRIIKGVAAGLLYLHEEWEQVVIHRDVKSSNVMLDGDYNARLGLLSLAKLYDHRSHPQTMHVVGTMGYLSPEFTRTGRATKATDVFAFGVFVLEVVCGRRPIESHAERGETVLVDWVVRKWVEGRKLAVAADGKMEGGYGKEEIERVLRLGLLCAHTAEESRPSMREVVQVLEGGGRLPEHPDEYYWKGCVSGGKAWL